MRRLRWLLDAGSVSLFAMLAVIAFATVFAACLAFGQSLGDAFFGATFAVAVMAGVDWALERRAAGVGYMTFIFAASGAYHLIPAFIAGIAIAAVLITYLSRLPGDPILDTLNSGTGGDADEACDEPRAARKTHGYRRIPDFI